MCYVRHAFTLSHRYYPIAHIWLKEFSPFFLFILILYSATFFVTSVGLLCNMPISSGYCIFLKWQSERDKTKSTHLKQIHQNFDMNCMRSWTVFIFSLSLSSSLRVWVWEWQIDQIAWIIYVYLSLEYFDSKQQQKNSYGQIKMGEIVLEHCVHEEDTML